AIGPAYLAANDDHTIGPQRRARPQHLREGLASPISGGAIMLGQVIGPSLPERLHEIASTSGRPRSSMPRAWSRARNLAEVSSAAAAGAAPATIPAPAKSVMRRSELSPHRNAMCHSPSPPASVQPIAPA